MRMARAFASSNNSSNFTLLPSRVLIFSTFFLGCFSFFSFPPAFFSSSTAPGTTPPVFGCSCYYFYSVYSVYYSTTAGLVVSTFYSCFYAGYLLSFFSFDFCHQFATSTLP